MRASLAVVFVCAAVGGALPGGAQASALPTISVETPGGDSVHPLPVTARVTVSAPDASVRLCEDVSCTLYRHYTVDEPGGSVVVRRHPLFGPVFRGERYGATSSVSLPSTYGGYGVHGVALYGTLVEGAPLRATLVRGSVRDASPAGGLAIIEATDALNAHPEHALAFSAVVLAPSALPDAELTTSLLGVLGLGGAVALPRSSVEPLSSLLEGASLKPLVADPGARLVELGSSRVMAEGPRELAASVAHTRGGVVIVYDDTRLDERLITDALLTAVPRFSQSSRLSYSDPRHSPASASAGLGVGRPSRPALVALPLLVALAVVLLAVRARRRGHGMITRGALALSLSTAVAFLVVPRYLDDGARLEVKTYVSFGDATHAFEEGARAERPPASGAELTLRGPAGSVPVAEIRGIHEPAPAPLHVEDGGSALRFFVPGDGIGVAAWLRPVALEGLRVTTKDGGWPERAEDAVITSRLPFALDEVWTLSRPGSLTRVGRLEPGATSDGGVTVASTAELYGERDGSDPIALARIRLRNDLHNRCGAYGAPPAGLACVFGIGTAPDGALVGVQVLSP